MVSQNISVLEGTVDTAQVAVRRNDVSWSKFDLLCYFALTVLGFSFWFLMAIPFASHRESYSWLASVETQSFAKAFSVISVTYRPFAQGTTWLAFILLKPSIFPTSILRESLLQGFVYVMFVTAWWLIYSGASQRRLLAAVACVTGAVFFSGYVHLFHLYGLFYVPVVLIIGALLRSRARGTFENSEIGFAAAAMILGFWHPFATALFVGFYFGYYLETFQRRSTREHIRALAILFLEMAAIVALVFVFPRPDALMSLHTRLLGFLVTYQTNEVNRAASMVAYLLTGFTIVSTPLSTRWKLGAIVLATAICVAFVLSGIPLLLLWVCAALIKLAYLREWSLFFMTLSAALLPFGGGIGAPVFALFAIILVTYATPFGWSQAERKLSLIDSRLVATVVVAALVIVIAIRMGVKVPVISAAAGPLLAERERTYQLERALAWLHGSDYCGCEVRFVDDAGSPIDSVRSAMNRGNRPPSGFEDVHYFWETLMKCQRTDHADQNALSAVITFGNQQVADSTPVFQVKGHYAGDAIVWVKGAKK